MGYFSRLDGERQQYEHELAEQTWNEYFEKKKPKKKKVSKKRLNKNSDNERISMSTEDTLFGNYKSWIDDEPWRRF